MTPETDFRNDVQQRGVGDGGADAVGEVWHKEIDVTIAKGQRVKRWKAEGGVRGAGGTCWKEG